MKYFRYLNYILRHKWFVFVAGLRVRAPFHRLVIHDWSKLRPSEFFPYVEYFYGERVEDAAFRRLYPRFEDFLMRRGEKHLEDLAAHIHNVRSMAFDVAWLHHQRRNKHHWQYWVLREDSGDTKTLPMPEPYAREMVADWMGAGRAITGRWEVAEWYKKNKQNIVLHPDTRGMVESLLVRSRP